MAHEDASVNAQLEAWRRVQATNGETIECLLDTGFNGALVLPRAEAVRLNLTVLSHVPIIGVGCSRTVADIAELEIEWLNQARAVEVIISGDEDSLLGTELHDGSRLVVDYVVTKLLNDGRSYREVQMVPKHKDPKTIMRYGYARENLDNNPVNTLSWDDD